jgi:Kef-type K+ transport system membrane component KefB
LQLAFILAVVIFSAKLAGYLSTRFGQPSVLGELLVGLLLGPSLIDVAHLGFITDTHVEEIITQIGELGVLLLMFIAGMGLHLNELARNTRVSALAGSLGVVVPVGLGWGIGRLLGLDTPAAIFLGLTLGATSVSISVQTLMELKALRSRVGLGLLGAAVFDDILVILLLSAFLALEAGSGGFWNILVIFLRMLLFLALSAGFGIWVLPRLVRRVAQLPISQGTLSLAVVVLLAYGITAELLGGVAAITGTFLAGLMFSRSPEKSRFENGMLSLGYSFFIPIFFVSIGLTINLREVTPETLWLLLGISLVGIVGKLFGAGLGAWLGGFSRLEALQLGAGMISRGEVGLIVASVGISQGLVSDSEFSAIIGMVLVTTLITPPLLRFLFSKSSAAQPAQNSHPDLPKPKPQEAKDVSDSVHTE